MAEQKELPAPSKSVMDEVVELRRHFHRHPEVSFSEQETSVKISERLRELGLEVQPCPTETGAVAVLDTGRPGKTVMLRADIDALPILEESGVDFESESEGSMHACGHDTHTAMMLGTARTLVDHIWDLNGRFLFVFQPAEEIVSGAKAMIAGGLLESHHPDAVLGLHIASFIESGTIVTKPGLMWAGSDAFEIGIKGPGGHGAWNIVPRGVRIKGSVRTFNAPLREEALGRLGDLLKETDTEFEVSSELQLVHGTVPIMNEPNVTRTVMEVATSIAGDRASLLGKPLTVSDDFAEFLTHIPGCYFMLGARPEGDKPPAHHSPGFRIDESAFPLGVSLMAGAAARIAGG